MYAIEKDVDVLNCAKHNAEIYNVKNVISWLQGDWFEVLSTQLADLLEYSVVFASPPWGGGMRLDISKNRNSLSIL